MQTRLGILFSPASAATCCINAAVQCDTPVGCSIYKSTIRQHSAQMVSKAVLSLCDWRVDSEISKPLLSLYEIPPENLECKKTTCLNIARLIVLRCEAKGRISSNQLRLVRSMKPFFFQTRQIRTVVTKGPIDSTVRYRTVNPLYPIP